MKSLKGSPRSRRPPTPANRRRQLLAAFERSGVSAAAFARCHGLGCTTFCGWRHRQTQSPPPPAFVQVQLAASAAPVELPLEPGAQAWLRLTSGSQIELAARLLRHLNTYPLVLGPDGKPRPELFVDDQLHFNAEGYRLLAARVRPFLP